MKLQNVPPGTAALSTDGEWLATTADTAVTVREAATGKVHRVLTAESPYDLEFSRDGRWLLCTTDSGLVIYDTANFQQQTFMRLEALFAGAFSPDSLFVAFTSMARRVAIWTVYGNREAAVLRHPGPAELRNIAFSADNRSLASADYSSVRVWNLAGAEEKLVLRGHEGGVTAVAFSPDGRRLASISKDKKLALWNSTTGELLGARAFTSLLQALAISPDGRMIAAGDYTGTLKVFDLESLDELTVVEHKLSADLFSAAFSADGVYFAASGFGMALWRIKRAEAADNGQLPKLAFEPVTHVGGNLSLYLRFSPDSRVLAWVDRYRTVRLWDLIAEKERPFGASPLLRGWHNLTFTPDGKQLLFISAAGQIEAWHVDTNTRAFSLGQPGEVTGSHIGLSPDGQWLAADFDVLTVGVWDMQTKERAFALPDERASVHSLAWSADSQRLAIGTKEGALAIWDITALRRQLATLNLDWISE